MLFSARRMQRLVSPIFTTGGFRLPRLLGVLGRGLVDFDEPIICADDGSFLRGDGVFECMLVSSGTPKLQEEHLDRLYRSASALSMVLPVRSEMHQLLDQVVAAWPIQVDGQLRLVCTRGAQSVPEPVIFATLTELPESTHRDRISGVRLITGSVGYAHNVRRNAPWLLGGAKTLSYAVNMSSHRYAERMGADEMLWLSADGFVLETPSFGVLWLEGGHVYTPQSDTGIVSSTTLKAVIAAMTSVGFQTGEVLADCSRLVESDAVWLTGSLSGILEVNSIDGQQLRSSKVLAEARELIGYPNR